jgi:hypothetical protein
MKARIHPITKQIETYTIKPKWIIDVRNNQRFNGGYPFCSDEFELMQCFVTVIDAELGENQHYSEVKKRVINDVVEFYRDAVDNPPMPIIFDSNLCLDDMFKLFENRIVGDTAFSARNAAFIELIKRQGFKGIYDISQAMLKITKLFSQTEYDAFFAIFEKQGIDLNDYKTIEE